MSLWGQHFYSLSICNVPRCNVPEQFAFGHVYFVNCLHEGKCFLSLLYFYFFSLNYDLWLQNLNSEFRESNDNSWYTSQKKSNLFNISSEKHRLVAIHHKFVEEFFKEHLKEDILFMCFR